MECYYCLFVVLVSSQLAAQGRVSIGYGLTDDGNCERVQQSVMTGYSLGLDWMSADAQVRTEPAGGDCRQDSLSYDVAVSRFFSIPRTGLDFVVKFAASEQSAAAPYDLVNQLGDVITRADGGALFSTRLPAGRAQTVVGVIGVSRQFGAARFGAGINLVPVQWARHADSRTGHFDASAEWRGLDVGFAVDIGHGSYGSARAGYRVPLDREKFDLGIEVHHRWGIGALDNGVPLQQTVAGAPFLLSGPPRDTATVIAVSLGYSP